MNSLRETESALRHLSSVHAASTRRTNEINQSSAKVNSTAASEIRHLEYLSAVHCADSAAAMAMPPVLGLREAVDLTQRACGELSATNLCTVTALKYICLVCASSDLLADQAMTAQMTVRLAVENEAVNTAELAAQKSWSRRRDARAEAAKHHRKAAKAVMVRTKYPTRCSVHV